MPSFFELPTHFEVVRRARAAVRTIHAMGPDTYTVIHEGEVSLVDRATLIELINRLSKEEHHDSVGGGDVDGAGGDAS